MNVAEIITNEFLKGVEEANILPWQRPWKLTDRPKNLVSGKPYHGVNWLMLALQERSSNVWATFKQIKEKGGFVNAGAKGIPVIYYNRVISETESGDERTLYSVLRYYTVFNLEDTSLKIEDFVTPSGDEIAEIPSADEIYSNYNIDLRFGGDQAYYSHSLNYVQMPPKNNFFTSNDYYAMLYHELIHSTGHKDRLNRLNENASMFDMKKESYSFEELVAEIGSAILLSHVGLSCGVSDNQKSYVAEWLKVLKGNTSWIIKAASKAEKAANLIMNVQDTTTESNI